ncbi:DUF1697 domain-containing protein [Thalassotalea piscium]|uniref:Uncharacterized protein (DUF1697 family) n=1 Tax=Thalassotalea piscium TaxID=1230533 RepID=A0A7X0TST2_9GAMM|nr:DUF1697 domain-containing protein [Thalassotalea piscium]MBB6542492.1 uncharacterized protein (DUF1697 family) [Thalassotalea piscium]
MQTFVILFRAINVGGNNKLPMKVLVPLLAKEGFTQIHHYLQTGNVILQSKENPTAAVQALVTQHFNFTPEVISLRAEDFLKAHQQSPFSDTNGKFIHFYFCKHQASLVLDKLDKYLAESEQYAFINNIFYLHAPEGIGRSKFVTHIESCLGSPATGRNLNTINKISAMLTSNLEG